MTSNESGRPDPSPEEGDPPGTLGPGILLLAATPFLLFIAFLLADRLLF